VTERGGFGRLVAALFRGRARYWTLGVAVLAVLGADLGLRVARMRQWVTTMVREGDPAPAFTLADARGQQVDLGDYLGRKPVVLVFYMSYQ